MYESYFDGKEDGIRQSIEIINELAEEYKGNYESVGVLKQIMWERDIAIEQLHELGYEFGEKIAEEHKGGWIPCSERLPDYSDNILVCTKNGGRTLAHLKHTPIEWRDMYMNKIDDVIAWKYLDAPYQPKGE